MSEELSLAMFVDFENLAIGIRDRPKSRFEINLVLKRLVEKGKVIVKKAYADWSQYEKYKGDLHEAGIELIEIPRRGQAGKNSADIRLCVDAMDLCYAKTHIDTFVILSGDSDFSPLVSKLKENGKSVIGLAMKGSTSELLVSNCDEFIYYEDLERPVAQEPTIPKTLPKRKRQAFELLIEAILGLVRENKDVLHSSMIKDSIKRKLPSFNESYYGYRSFTDLLEDAEKNGIIRLKTDSRSGTYVVTGFGEKD